MHLNQYKLELKWISSEYHSNIHKSELSEIPQFSCNTKNNASMLIHGDNYEILKHLQMKFEDKIKCIYIDPPFNTGAHINSKGMKINYHDELEHSIWLGMMNLRLLECKKLLSQDGTLFLHLNENECAYAKVLLDNIFGRSNYVNTIILKTHDPSGFKVTGKAIFSSANYILVYAKNRQKLKLHPIYLQKKYDKSYCYWIYNRNENYEYWQFENIKEATAKIIFKAKSYKNLINSLTISKEEFESKIAEFALKNPTQIFRLAPIGGGAKIKRQTLIDFSKKNKGKIFKYPEENKPDFYILNGDQILFYDKRFNHIDGKLCPTEIMTNIWCDIPWNGIAKEGGVAFCNAKKPESLIKRILTLATNEGDWVLDCFLGSGTTTAVAHKMKRNWIGIEKGKQIFTHAHKRMKDVIEGNDQSGISKELNWKGGGGFNFYELLYNSEEWRHQQDSNLRPHL